MSFIFSKHDVSGFEDGLKRGARVKHEWLRQMEVGDGYTIPEEFNIQTMRILISNYGKKENKKFSLKSASRLVVRIA